MDCIAIVAFVIECSESHKDISEHGYLSWTSGALLLAREADGRVVIVF